MSSTGGRILREVTLDDPIRYSLDDPIEKWLYDLLCLDVSNQTSESDFLNLILGNRSRVT